MDIMSIKNRFQVRDIVVTIDDFGARTFVIIEVTTVGYRAVAMKDKKRYNLSDNQIASKLGTVLESSPFLVLDEYQPIEQYCLEQAREHPSEAVKWKALAKLKPGSSLALVHRKTVFKNAEFVAINFNKPLYPIRAKIKNMAYDFHLEAMILED